MNTSNNIVFAKAKTKNQGNYHTGHFKEMLIKAFPCPIFRREATITFEK